MVSHRNLLLLGIAAVLGSVSAASPASAQAIYPGPVQQRPAPYKPRLSPYLDLLRRDNSVLTPYHSFVVPRRELYSRQLSQAAQINQMQRSYQQTQRRQAPGNRMPTGRGGQFMNYLHYFPRSDQP